MSKTYAIITAGGKGSRMKQALNKVFLNINSVPIIAKTIEKFQNSNMIDKIIIVSAYNEIEIHKKIIEKFNFNKVSNIVIGAETRQKSVYNGIKAIKEDCSIVLIHDAARPFVSKQIIEEGIKYAKKYSAASPGVTPKATLKKISEENFIMETIDRNSIYEIQTPQCFDYSIIKSCHEKVDKNVIYTDDNMILESCGYKIKVYEGDYFNIKITTVEDIFIAESIDTHYNK